MLHASANSNLNDAVGISAANAIVPAAAAPVVPVAPVAPPINFISTLAKLVIANQQQVVDDDVYTNQLSKWVAQGKIKNLDVATIFGLQAADKTITQADLEHLEGILNPLVVKLNAQIDFNAATNNFDLSVTNRPLVVTNLAGALNNQRRLIANISIPQTSPDAGMFTAFTNHWDTMIKGEDDYAAVQTNQPSRPYYAFFTAGAEFLNPYVVSVPNATVHGTGTLTNAGSSTVGFLEFDYINRHVLRADGAYYGPSWLFKPGTHFYPDAQFNIGFLLGGGAGLTNTSYSAQTLAGADFYSQFTLGIPIVRLDRPEQSHQISVELSGGVTTESQFEIVHPNAFAGLGYQVAFKPIIGLATTNNCGFFSARFGAGWVDVPSLVGTNNLVNLDGNGIPIFDFKPSCEFGAYLAYPLTQSTYLTVDANTFFGDNPPNSWNIKVGLSIPLEKISGIFTQ